MKTEAERSWPAAKIPKGRSYWLKEVCSGRPFVIYRMYHNGGVREVDGKLACATGVLQYTDTFWLHDFDHRRYVAHRLRQSRKQFKKTVDAAYAGNDLQHI